MTTDEHRGTTMADRRRDRGEVEQFMAANPNANVSEVAMCCHMGTDQAKRILKRIDLNIRRDTSNVGD